MKNIVTLLVLLLTTQAEATRPIPLDQQIGSFTVEETTGLKNFKSIIDGEEKPGTDGEGPTTDIGTGPVNDRIEKTGRVISVAKDMVALGEAIYELVKKGRPTNVTEFAAISVVPKDKETKQHVDPFELEGFSMPVERNFTAKITNGLGKEVVKFDYAIVYSYGGSWNGSGKYLTNVMIVPKNIRTTFGWDFNATMKLSGIMNHGSKADPVAGAMVTVKYQMNSWTAAFERNDTVHLTGNGELKNFGIK